VRWRAAAYTGGIAALWIAVASPLAHLDHHLLTAHMINHLLLMVIAAPLILLGIRLPRRMHWRPPLTVCWLVGSLTVIFWHLPVIFGLALNSPLWHQFEHASFFMAGVVFWWPVIHSGFGPGSWSIPVYLFLATLPCDVLSAFLVFCDRIVYAPYTSGIPAFGLLPIEDQALAGALMWVTVTFAYMIPALLLTAHLVSGERRRDAGTSVRLPRLQIARENRRHSCTAGCDLPIIRTVSARLARPPFALPRGAGDRDTPAAFPATAASHRARQNLFVSPVDRPGGRECR